MNMHADENSDGVIVPEKRPNKEGLPSAEAVEGRTPPKGNGGETAAARTLPGIPRRTDSSPCAERRDRARVYGSLRCCIISPSISWSRVTFRLNGTPRRESTA